MNVAIKEFCKGKRDKQASNLDALVQVLFRTCKFSTQVCNHIPHCCAPRKAIVRQKPLNDGEGTIRPEGVGVVRRQAVLLHLCNAALVELFYQKAVHAQAGEVDVLAPAIHATKQPARLIGHFAELEHAAETSQEGADAKIRTGFQVWEEEHQVEELASVYVGLQRQSIPVLTHVGTGCAGRGRSVQAMVTTLVRILHHTALVCTHLCDSLQFCPLTIHPLEVRRKMVFASLDFVRAQIATNSLCNVQPAFLAKGAFLVR